MLLMSGCVGGTASAGDVGGSSATGTGTGANSGVFPDAQWTVNLPDGSRTFADVDGQEFAVVGVALPGHLRYLDAVGGTSFQQDTGQLGCLARGVSGETAVVIDDELQFRDLAGGIAWSVPAEQPCQLAIGVDRVVLAEAQGVRVFNINGQAINAQPTNVDMAVIAPSSSSYRRTLDVDGVIGYANLNHVGGLTLDGEPTFDLDLPDIEVKAVRVREVDVIVAGTISSAATVCGQTVNVTAGDTRAVLMAFAPNGQCVWSYELTEAGASPLSADVLDLAVGGESLFAVGESSAGFGWADQQLEAGNFLVELSLSNITPARATNSVVANAIELTTQGHLLTVSGSAVSLLH
jgi:hypothetical protein